MHGFTIQRTEIECKSCSYKWFSTVKNPKHRIRCPNCHSSKNDINYKLFGKWNPGKELARKE